MFLGRFTLGQFAPVSVVCHDADIAFAPTFAPTMAIFDSSLTKLTLPFTSYLVSVDPGSVTGLFILNLFLGEEFDIGHYSAVINYTANSVKKLAVCHFEVVDGGDENGAIISMAAYRCPHAFFLVQKLDSNKRRLARNPRST